MNEFTEILQQIENGSAAATDRLLPLVYDELRKMASAKLAKENPGHTLQATALVHEAYMRLVGTGQEDRWVNRAHFFGAAAEAMRRVLVDNARRKLSAKRGGDFKRENLELVNLAGPVREDRLLALDEALEKLQKQDTRSAEVVKLRYFAGLTIPEVARVLGVSPRTADSIWAYARSWLIEEMSDGELPSEKS